MVNQLSVAHVIILCGSLNLLLVSSPQLSAEPPGQRVRDRLWLWTHPAGCYNHDYLKDQSRKSSIEPVAAVDSMGLRNAYFIRYKDIPALPFDGFYAPFKRLDQVTWSLTGASGATSDEERDHVLQLAEKHKNITNFIMDDFFHHTCHLPLHWLAEENVEFPVSLTLRSNQPTVANRVRLIQTEWFKKDFRSKGYIVETSADGRRFDQVASGEFPNESGAVQDVTLPRQPLQAIRFRILGTHDSEPAAMSCGLRRIEFFHDQRQIATEDWEAETSSQFDHHAPRHVVVTEDSVPMPAALSPEQLRQLRTRLILGGRRVPLHVVVYSHQLKPRAAHHLELVDAITLWTWVPSV